MSSASPTDALAAWLARHGSTEATFAPWPATDGRMAVGSREARAFWLPSTGPTVLAAMQLLADWTGGSLRPIEVDLSDLAFSLGVDAGDPLRRWGKVRRTLDRMIGFKLARAHGLPGDVDAAPNVVHFRLDLPDVFPRMRTNWPHSRHDAYARWLRQRELAGQPR